MTVNPKQITKILHSDTGHNTIFDLQLDGGKEKVMIVDWQYEPIKGKLLHIDMKRIDMERSIRVSVPIELSGEVRGREDSRAASWTRCCARSRSSACRPTFPGHIDADVSQLVFGEVIRVTDLPHGGKLKFITR